MALMLHEWVDWDTENQLLTRASKPDRRQLILQVCTRSIMVALKRKVSYEDFEQVNVQTVRLSRRCRAGGLDTCSPKHCQYCCC